MSVRQMTQQDLALVLDWAADEGWNPGLDDAAAFFATDPQGFFVKTKDRRPVAAISVVNLNADHAFLGLYICHPDHRGQGYGMEVWQAGLAHAAGRCVGLDGVPDQQDNYARSGFAPTGQTVRLRGVVPCDPESGAIAATDRHAVSALDMRATGLLRDRFVAAWFTDTPTRRTLCVGADTESFALATFRQCRNGVKVGPLYAQSQTQVMALLRACPSEFGDGPLFIDVPDTAPALRALVEDNGFSPTFQTARMYSGAPPLAQPPRFHAVATLELG